MISDGEVSGIKKELIDWGRNVNEGRKQRMKKIMFEYLSHTNKISC